MAGFSFRSRALKILPALSAPVILAACSVGPDYVRPTAPVPAKFKESKDWRPARPRDGADRGAWWTVYRDAELNRLLPQVAVTNQNVAASLASYEQARAVIRETQASLLPAINGQYPVTRSGEGSGVLSSGGSGTTSLGTNTSHAFARTLFYPQGTVGWTIDIWGKIGRQVEGNVALAQADSALLANATLSAQAQLAIAYFNLRYQDSLKDLLNRTVKIYQETEKITRNQYNSGTVSKADLITAQTQVLNTQAQAIATDVLRQQYEHAIAALVGRPPSELTIRRGALARMPPATPPGLPSTLLERRPDIAAAERAIAEQNALVGVAVGAYYPTITLSAAGGFEGANAFPFLAAYQVWSLGAAAADPLFDGGLRAAQVDAAKAAWRQSVANYRQTVLTAFQQVEDQLVALRVYAKELRVREKARDAAAEAVRVYLNQYRAGTVAFTTVVVAEATLLADEESVLATRQALFTANVTLIEALGGGYDAESLAAEKAPPLIEAAARSLPAPPP
ncbi:efflux transporter outer membrane subunit [Rhodoblastus acidophilus]|uniref:Efflux transporter outer membrane subunit n=1 Tax=Candidatus Rhodoblastus alkanivorans TaxID=2954117 RepID=A0ABS9Z6G8_9HYPH|nr:efflux transporter outer membrane subunit [Candidatus Rhodoblastus alkanivorans]MCI4679695.1 efflux transporter outer membrane subunit [Candidatus Rhodoblastus alkanivorans]MCI4683243.1 efflux transporter outer membrane subunit [Candidatus Rhodoblastus alkanivorans]MDI4640555.1 efflux transporter outer membrane subunit [Rhodoblastus acidophilus]